MVPTPVLTGAGSTRECRVGLGEWVPAPVFTGTGSTREQRQAGGEIPRGTQNDRGRCAQNDRGRCAGNDVWREERRGWVPAPVFTGTGSTRKCRVGLGGMGSRPRLHGDRLYAGTTAGGRRDSSRDSE